MVQFCKIKMQKRYGKHPQVNKKLPERDKNIHTYMTFFKPVTLTINVFFVCFFHRVNLILLQGEIRIEKSEDF